MLVVNFWSSAHRETSTPIPGSLSASISDNSVIAGTRRITCSDKASRQLHCDPVHLAFNLAAKLTDPRSTGTASPMVSRILCNPHKKT